MEFWRKKLPDSEVRLTWPSGYWSFRYLVAAKQQQAILLLDFGHIRQNLSDIGDTVRIVVMHRDIDIGPVMWLKLTAV